MDAKKNISVVLLVCLCIVIGWFGRGYYDKRTAADGHDALGTIQQIKADNESVRNDIGDAATQIDDAQANLDAGQGDLATATGRLDELQSRADADAAVLDECQGILDVSRKNIEEAKRIFADVDRENKLDE